MVHRPLRRSQRSGLVASALTIFPEAGMDHAHKNFILDVIAHAGELSLVTVRA